MKIAINQSMKFYPITYTVNLKDAASGNPIASVYLSPAEVENKNISAGIMAITSSVQHQVNIVGDTNNEFYQYSTEDLKPLYRMVLERAGNEKELNAALRTLPVQYFGEQQSINNSVTRNGREDGVQHDR